ncbi:MAG: YfhO family protein [Bacteroidales bacterium]|nr:YfhO family protein [Bacteroidales bacterium]
MKKWFELNKWYLVALMSLLVLCTIYVGPVLSGKTLIQSDIVQAKGMQKELQDYKAAEGRLPLWTNTMFGGMPAVSIITEHPKNITTYILNFINRLFPSPLNILVLYTACGFLLFYLLGFSPWISFIGAISIAFTSYNFIIIEVGHINKAFAISFFPLIVAGVLLLYRNKLILGGIITALALALQIRVSHPQMTYYLMFGLLIFAIVEFVYSVKGNNLASFVKSSVVSLVAVGIAVLVNAGILWVNYEYAKDSMRGKTPLVMDESEVEEKKESGLSKEYAYAWSQGIGECITFVIPAAYGGASGYPLGKDSEVVGTMVKNGVSQRNAEDFASRMPVYWGEKSFTSGPWYFGAITMFLFVLGLIIVRGKHKWWLLAATLFSVLLSFGRHMPWFSNLFFDYIPLYNKFRAVESTLVLAALTIPILAMMALKEFSEGTDKTHLQKALLQSFYITGGFVLIFVLVPGMFLSFRSSNDDSFIRQLTQMANSQLANSIYEALLLDRASLARSDAFRSLVLISIAFGSLFMFIKGKLKPGYLFAIVGLATLVDLWGVDKRFLNSDSFVEKRNMKRYTEPRAVDRQIMQDKNSYYRVYDISADPFNNSIPSQFHKTLGGYNGAKLRIYQDLIDHQVSKGNMQVMNMLNTRYFIVKGQQGEQVQYNAGALGNGWFVDSLIWAATPRQEMQALDSFNAATTAIVSDEFKPFVPNALQGDSGKAADNIALTAYHPERLTFSTRTSADRVAVFSDIYYPKGWKAYVDGKEVPHFRANYVLRALLVPAGEHTVEFRFSFRPYELGENISLAASVLLGLLLMGFLAGRMLPKKQ